MSLSTSSRLVSGTDTRTSASSVATGSVYRICATAPNKAYSWITPACRISLSNCASSFTGTSYRKCHADIYGGIAGAPAALREQGADPFGERLEPVWLLNEPAHSLGGEGVHGRAV